MSKRHLQDDPLTRAIAPPPDETIQQRDSRIHQEREAKRISDEIDEELRKGLKKGPKPVKILLLGAWPYQ
jgi:guanine nucleotide-binding protein subunit alpha